tara:strand:+ start:461 stop:1978 length:1518 start_codon:yes stop_codon:yes gene_type:complete
MALIPNPGGNGAFPASITPMPNQVTVQDNYVNFQDIAGGFNQWAQQYLPELYEQEVERYGNRTLSGFLRMVGAEMPMTSDQVIWTEQNRLHVAYDNALVAAGANSTITITITPGANNPATSAIREGNTILITDVSTGLLSAKALVTDRTSGGTTDGYTIAAILYETTSAALAAGLKGAGNTVKLFVYGSEFPKGSNGMGGAIEPGVTTFVNSPIILKDNYELSGSDAAQIGWIEVATEDGTSGYLWYLKAESETRLRFEDYMEMSMVEGVLQANVNANTQFPGGAAFGGPGAGQQIKGTEGLFAAIENRGNVFQGFAGAAAPGSGALSDFDAILKNLDKQGAIEENMLFLSRSTALDFDDMLAATNGGYASTTAASYGLFDNESEMALNFGFSGFRRGSYDFYKTDWKYLNDATTRGMSKQIDGVMIPAGTSTVYDQMLGSNIRRPFLHVRYRASETEDRRFKAWITGSVGGAYTTDLDTMRVNFLSERCLVTQAANNFVLFKGA